MTKTLVLMQGPPGSGKSTEAKKIAAASPGAVVVSADDYFIRYDGSYRFDPSSLADAHAACRRAAERAMGEGAPMVIVDNTNIKRDHAASYLALAAFFQYAVEVKRCEGRYPNIHGVPQKKVAKMRKEMEVLS